MYANHPALPLLPPDESIATSYKSCVVVAAAGWVARWGKAHTNAGIVD